MTEDEAKAKWCPFARTMLTPDTPLRTTVYMQSEVTPRSATCIGSACMAWRWDELPGKVKYTIGTDAKVSQITYTGAEVSQVTPRHGHCGLAGKP